MKNEEFIKTLESDHRKIEDLFKELKSLSNLEAEDAPALISNKLRELKSFLITHVHNEDEAFYPDLRFMAKQQGQDALLPAFDMFSKSMHEISDEAVAFFDEYATEKEISENPLDFSKRLNELNDKISKRIKSEEGSLFYIYKGYFNDKDF